MLRSIFIYLSKANWMRSLVMRLKLARKVALRFVAGEQLSDAIEAVRILNQKSMIATLDQLGEDANTIEETQKTTEGILTILETIEESGVRSNLSIKPSQIGLSLDEEVCSQNLEKILTLAKKLKTFVRIDMEDSPLVDATLRLYWKMRNEKGFDNIGVVIQSYLFRSDEDTKVLLKDDTRIRMVKGAYKEPPEVAYPKKKDVDDAFDRLVDMILENATQDSSPTVSADGKWPPTTAVASHDENRVNHAIESAQKLGIPKQKLEFQMLYGIRRGLQEKLVEEGYPVRIYVPFGTEWYPYFMRRLAERPANLWFFISSLFRG